MTRIQLTPILGAILLLLSGSFALAQAPSTTGARGGIILRVTDESGLVLPTAEVMLHYMQPDDKRSRGVKGEVGSDGAINVGPNMSLNTTGRRIIIHAYAPGYASERLETVWDGSLQQFDMRLTPGKTVGLSLNAPWAVDGLPDRLRITGAVDEGKQTAVSHAFELEPDPSYNYTPMRRTGPGTYEFQVREDFDENLYFLVHSDDLIRYYQAGPISPAQIASGFINIDLPKPSAINLSFGPHNMEGVTAEYVSGGAILTLNAENRYNMTERYLMAFQKPFPFETTEFEESIDRLAPGRYGVQFFLETSEGQRVAVGSNESIRTSSLRDQSVSQRLDNSVPRGDYSLTINVRNQERGLVGGVPYKLTLRQGRETKTIDSGDVPEGGQLRLTGLLGGDEAAPYMLEIDGMRIGSINLREGARSRTINVRLPPRAGDMAPDFILTALGDREENINLTDYRGQVVFLDFWASWCGPCQKPMAEMDAIMARRAGDWEGRALILGVNIDDEYEKMANHIESKGWTNVSHGWSHADGRGFRSAAPRAYGVSAIPTAFLVDPEGRIAWRGHPNTIDKEEAIDDLLAEHAAGPEGTE